MKTIKEARELLLLDIREDMEELMNSLIPPYSRVEGGGKNPYEIIKKIVFNVEIILTFNKYLKKLN